MNFKLVLGYGLVLTAVECSNSLEAQPLLPAAPVENIDAPPVLSQDVPLRGLQVPQNVDAPPALSQDVPLRDLQVPQNVDAPPALSQDVPLRDLKVPQNVDAPPALSQDVPLRDLQVPQNVDAPPALSQDVPLRDLKVSENIDAPPSLHKTSPSKLLSEEGSQGRDNTRKIPLGAAIQKTSGLAETVVATHNGRARGTLRLKVTATGAATFVLELGRRVHRSTGYFSPEGHLLATFGRAPGRQAQLRLSLEASTDGVLLGGTFSDSNASLVIKPILLE